MRCKTLNYVKLVAGTSLMLFTMSSNAFGTEKVKETLVIAQKSDAKTLDPQKSIDTISNKVIYLMFEALLSSDENLNVHPNLAESWEEIDELTTVFHLKKGVKFHDGEILTSEDVVYSLNRARMSPQAGYNFTPIVQVEALDDYTVKIMTDKPFGAMLKNLSIANASIISKKSAEKYGEDFFKNPVGCGPYKFVKWLPGDRIEVELFREYHGDLPENKKIVIRSIPEVSNRMIALETGEADIAFDIGMMDKEAVRNHKDLTLSEVESPSTLYLGFDETNPVFQNLKLRQAIAYAIDNNILAEAVFQGSAKPGISPMPPVISSYNQDVKNYERNVEKAKELMREAGYENGLKVELWVNDEATRIDMATIIQDQVRDIGLDLEIKVWEWGAYISRTAQKNKDLYLLSWNTSSGDGDAALYPLFHSKEQGASGNRSYYHNEKVDALLLEARYTVDQSKRDTLYRETQAIIQEELPHYTLVYPMLNMGARKDVKNVVLKKNGYINIKGVK